MHVSASVLHMQTLMVRSSPGSGSSYLELTGSLDWATQEALHAIPTKEGSHLKYIGGQDQGLSLSLAR